MDSTASRTLKDPKTARACIFPMVGPVEGVKGLGVIVCKLDTVLTRQNADGCTAFMQEGWTGIAGDVNNIMQAGILVSSMSR